MSYHFFLSPLNVDPYSKAPAMLSAGNEGMGHFAFYLYSTVPILLLGACWSSACCVPYLPRVPATCSYIAQERNRKRETPPFLRWDTFVEFYNIYIYTTCYCATKAVLYYDAVDY